MQTYINRALFIVAVLAVVKLAKRFVPAIDADMVTMTAPQT